MARAASASKKLPSWERRPWPLTGDSNPDVLYAAIGRALSEWERVEAALAYAFVGFVSSPTSLAARRAYSAVRTFEGRADMLRAASEAYFSVYPDAATLEEYKSILSRAKCLSLRRNDIAHGAVSNYRPEPPNPPIIPEPKLYALFPSFASFKERSIEDEPTYCYAAPELEYFRQQFYELKGDARMLAIKLIEAERARASEGKLLRLHRLYRESASPNDH